MRTQFEVAALVVLVAVMTIGMASAEPEAKDGTPGPDNPILTALGIQGREAEGSEETSKPKIDITTNWIDKHRLSIEVVGESETEPRGLARVRWNRRQVAEIELLEMPSGYCDTVGTDTPCYLVAAANEHDELKAPLGAWHATDEDVPEIYTGLPSVGVPVHISPNILGAASVR